MKDIISSLTLLFLNYQLGSLEGNTLFRSLEKQDLFDTAACNDANAISCAKAEVDIEALQQDFIQLPGGITLYVKKRGDNTATFQDELGQEAVFAWQDGEIAGQVHLVDTIWSLESCGEICGWQHVWVEQSTNFKDEETLVVGEEYTDDAMDGKLKKLGEEDTTTVVTYSVMIWYTQDFRNLFATENALNLFVDLVIEETNTGYTNSKIPVQVKKHCVKKHPTLNDIYEAGTMLNSFRSSMILADLKNSADAAGLLVANSSSCGIAYTHTTPSCTTLSVTMKRCAAGYYSFGHEIGHNFGGKHNPEKYTSSQLESHPYLHGHGHLIQPTGSTLRSGSRSILAYNAFGHYNRKNYYSNPDVTLPESGTPTGVLPYSNNAKVITENRFAMAACGDETRSCDASLTTISDSSSTTTPVSNSGSGCNLDDQTFSTWNIPGTTETILGMYILSSCKASHDEASSLCNQKGGRLFEPRNMATTRAVQKYVYSETSLYENVWFGITDSQTEGTWVYESDSTEGPTWLNWSKNRPFNTDGGFAGNFDFGTLYNCPLDGCCGPANGGAQEMCWLDRNKLNGWETKFLCEKNDDLTTPTSPATSCNLDDQTFSAWNIPSTTETIPGMYILSNCKASHDEASSLCIQKGGRLFEPRNMATTRAVQKYVYSETSLYENVWFGITDSQTEGTWVYESDSTEGPTWLNWSKNRPFNTDGGFAGNFDFGTLYNCPLDGCCGPANGGAQEMCWLDRNKLNGWETKFLCEKNDDLTTPTSPSTTSPDSATLTPPQSSTLPSLCRDDGCRNAFDGLGMCVDTSNTDWGTMHKKIDFYAGTKDGQCSTECSCTCFKHIGCKNTQCSAKKGICVTPNQIPPIGYIKSFPCDEYLNCFCYLKPSPPCKPHPKCKKSKGRCYSRTDTIPTNAKYLGHCNKKAGCKCYKTIDMVTISPITPITPIIKPNPCKPNSKCKKMKGKCYGKSNKIPANAKYVGWCNKKAGCKCYKSLNIVATLSPGGLVTLPINPITLPINPITLIPIPIQCKPNKKCRKKKGRCYGKLTPVPSKAKYLGWCDVKRGCKCYKA